MTPASTRTAGEQVSASTRRRVDAAWLILPCPSDKTRGPPRLSGLVQTLMASRKSAIAGQDQPGLRYFQSSLGCPKQSIIVVQLQVPARVEDPMIPSRGTADLIEATTSGDRFSTNSSLRLLPSVNFCSTYSFPPSWKIVMRLLPTIEGVACSWWFHSSSEPASVQIRQPLRRVTVALGVAVDTRRSQREVEQVPCEAPARPSLRRAQAAVVGFRPRLRCARCRSHGCS